MESAPVAALIGTRMVPHSIEQPNSAFSTLPAVTYEIISSTENMLLSDRSGLVWARFQFIAYGNTLRCALAVARAMKNNGVCQLKGTVNGVDIRGVDIVSGIQTTEDFIGDGEQASGSQKTRFLAEFDLMVSYKE